MKVGWVWTAAPGLMPLVTANIPISDVNDFKGSRTIDLTTSTLSSPNITKPTLHYNGTFAAAVSGQGGPSSSSSTTMLIAHGFLMAFAFVILFPSFAACLHIIPCAKTVTRIHAPLQIFTLCIVLAGLGIGAWLGVTTNQMNTYHPIIGMIVVGGLLLFQPLLGLSQHLHFRKTGGKAWSAYIHRWFGRVMMLLGIINGGLGFMLAGIESPGVPTAAVIAYSVIAGAVVITYFIVLVVRMVKSNRNPEDGHKP